ncbi:Ni/Fe-hydrogenase 1 B-type cytochrome subunit [Pedobacter sp. UYP30]|uniref:cytochrome b/b6 domain-containing protein n=1 Tax=Pedobacter sp. UYP30 TaxID=1756400 RepID=UPI0033971FF1
MSTKKYDLKIRIWHWLTALVITGSLLTVLINSTLLDRSQSSAVQKELQSAGVQLSTQQARAATHGLEDQVWGIHIYFGYALAILFVFRLITEAFLPKEKKFLFKVKEAYRIYRNGRLANMRHNFFVKVLYAIFYLLLLIMVCTGLSLAFQGDLGISRQIGHSIKEVHGFCMYLVLGYIVIHIAGVLLAESRDSKGIVSDMINGGSDSGDKEN